MATTPNGEGRASPPATATGGNARRPQRHVLLRRIAAGIGRLVRKSALAAAVVVLMLAGVRAYRSTEGPPLRPWHTIVPVELSADAITHGNWQAYVAAETRMFDQLHRSLQSELEPRDRTPLNRYRDASLVSPAAFGRDWNRSF